MVFVAVLTNYTGKLIIECLYVKQKGVKVRVRQGYADLGKNKKMINKLDIHMTDIRLINVSSNPIGLSHIHLTSTYWPGSHTPK